MEQLVLLHGALGHPEQFDPIKKELQKYFEVHELLFAGHGNASLPENEISIDDFVEQLDGFLESRRLAKVHVFGYSMGGYVAMCHSLRHKSPIQSILTLATKFDWNPALANKEAMLLNPETIEKKVPHFAKKLEAMHGSEKWKDLVRAMAKMLIDLGKYPRLSRKEYNKISIPSQLMLGDSDKMVSIEETKKVAAEISGSRLAILPATKHPLEKTRPELLLNLIKDFWGVNR